ncbi:MAG: ImmA/IrrE family metallo-endopeptidase [Paracoccaceae bacterium]
MLHREMLEKQCRLARHADSLYDEHAQKNVAVPFNPHHEVEANKLATEIIMPRQQIERLYDPSKDNFGKVAKQLGVSKSALVIRLKILGLLPNSKPAQPDL